MALAAALLFVAGCSQSHDQAERLYISNEGGDAVVAIDPHAGIVVQTIEAGHRPRGLLLSPDGAELYVAVSGTPIADSDSDEDAATDSKADGIAVIDLASGHVARMLNAGEDPANLAFSPDGHTLYVANQSEGAVTAIAASGGGKPISADVGDEPEGLAITPDGANLFVACAGSDRVAMLDAHSLNPVRTIELKGRPRGLLLSRDGKTVFVSVENAGQLALLSAVDGALIKRIDLAQGDAKVKPVGMAEGPDGHIFVTTGKRGAVLEVDTGLGTIVRTIDHVGARPWGIAITADGDTLVTANGSSSDVSVIDREAGEVVRKFRVGDGPRGVAGRPLGAH